MNFHEVLWIILIMWWFRLHWDFSLSKFWLCWDFVILGFWHVTISVVRILACQDLGCWDYNPEPLILMEMKTHLLLCVFELHFYFFFVLSEHILCKESIVIGKKFDFEILTYLYILRSPEFIYAIFTEMYACICAYVCEGT